MPETITFHALDLSGETGLKLYLRKSDGSLLNTGGDTFTEPATGMFQTTLTESRTGLGSLAVRVCDGTETADNLLYDGFLPEGSTVIGATVELDSASVSAVQSGLATAASVAAEAVKTAAIQAKTDNLPSDPADQSLIIAATDAVMTRLGSPAGASIAADIAAIDGGGGGGGDATLAKQGEILTAVESVVDTVAAYAARMALEVQLRGFPNVICRNADYLEATESEIRITVKDLTGAAITEIAGTPVASLSWLFGMGTETAPNLIAGTCTWDAGTDELVIEIAKAATAGKQTGSLTWQIGVSIGAARRWLCGGTTRLIERQF